MAFTDPRSLSLSDQGYDLVTLCQYTLADYTAAGTNAGAEGDIVTISVTGNWYVTIQANNATEVFGEVVKVVKAASGSAVGLLAVRWLDVIRFVAVTTDDMTTVTLGNAAIKDGDTTVVDNFDAGATTGRLKVVAKSAAAGAGEILCAVVA